MLIMRLQYRFLLREESEKRDYIEIETTRKPAHTVHFLLELGSSVLPIVYPV